MAAFGGTRLKKRRAEAAALIESPAQQAAQQLTKQQSDRAKKGGKAKKSADKKPGASTSLSAQAAAAHLAAAQKAMRLAAAAEEAEKRAAAEKAEKLAAFKAKMSKGNQIEQAKQKAYEKTVLVDQKKDDFVRRKIEATTLTSEDMARRESAAEELGKRLGLTDGLSPEERDVFRKEVKRLSQDGRSPGAANFSPLPPDDSRRQDLQVRTRVDWCMSLKGRRLICARSVCTPRSSKHWHA